MVDRGPTSVPEDIPIQIPFTWRDMEQKAIMFPYCPVFGRRERERRNWKYYAQRADHQE